MRAKIAVRSLVMVTVLIALLSSSALPALSLESQQSSWQSAQEDSAQAALDNLLALTLQSGMGVAFRLPAPAAAALLRQAGLNRPPWRNAFLVQAPYASGDPAYVQQPEPVNAQTLHWDPAKMDRTVSPQALAWAIINELAWVKRFEREPAPDVQRRAVQSWEGRLLGRLALLGTLFAQTNLRDPQTGLYFHGWRGGAIVDRAFLPLDQITLLWAWSKLATASPPGGNILVSPEQARQMARQLFSALSGGQGLLRRASELSPREAGLGVEALVSYAATLSSPQEIRPVLQLIREMLPRLSSAQGDWSAQAEAVTALLSVYRLSGERTVLLEALRQWKELQKLWDPQAELFASRAGDAPVYLYSVQELGDAVGAFNAIIHLAELNKQDRAKVQSQYAKFFNGALQAARPQSPSAVIVSKFGRAPVFIASVRFDPTSGRWQPVNRRFVSGGALYLAARLNWIGRWQGQEFSRPSWGFPQSDSIALQVMRRQLAALQGLAEQKLPERLTQLEESLQEQLQTQQALSSQLAALQPLQRQVEVLSGQLAALQRQVQALSGQLTQEQKRSKTQLTALSQQVKTLQSTGQSSEAGQPLGSRDSLTVLLVVLLLLVGWTAFEWVRRRPA